MFVFAGGIFAGAQLVIVHNFLGGGGDATATVPGIEWELTGARLHWEVPEE